MLSGCQGLPNCAEDTADFLLFFDNLFDSMNGSVIKPEHGKLLRCAISNNSGHLVFWREAKNVLKSMVFLNGNKTFVPPCITNWIDTIKGFE